MCDEKSQPVLKSVLIIRLFQSTHSCVQMHTAAAQIINNYNIIASSILSHHVALPSGFFSSKNRGATLEESEELLNENPKYVETETEHKESKSVTPLHDACKRSVTWEDIIKLLVRSPEYVKIQDEDGALPLHYACENMLSFEVIEALIDHYPESLGTKNKQGKSPFECDYEKSPGKHFTEFVNYLVRPQKSEKYEDQISPCVDTSPWDTTANFLLILRTLDLDQEVKDLLCKNHVPIKLARIGFLDEKNLKSKRLIRLLNNMLCRKAVVCVKVFILYLHIAWIYMFVSASYLYEPGQSSGWRPPVLIAFASIFLIVELNQMHRLYTTGAIMFYCIDPQNWLDLTTTFMVLVSAIKLHVDSTIDGRMLMATGCFQSLFLLSFLKKTFFPFYKFVTGITKIILALVPFLVVSVVTLFTFSFMYFIQDRDVVASSAGEEDEDYSTLMSSFQTVVKNAGFSSDTSSPLDYVFGIIIMVVLLNVVIAVVSEEWEGAGEGAYSSFWKYRLRLIIEDTRGWKEDSWLIFILEDENSPLNRCLFSEAFDWERIFVHSASSGGGPTMENIQTQLEMMYREHGLLKCTRCLIQCFLLIVLGFPTFGLLWPKFFRQVLFTTARPKSVDSELERERLENKVNELSEKVSDLLEQFLKNDIPAVPKVSDSEQEREKAREQS